MTLHREPPARVPAPAETACADWLALRAEADTRARDEGSADLLRTLVDRLDRSDDAQIAGVRVVDLGAGTGANHRYLAPRLPLAQRWTAVDHDATLLASPAHDGADRVVADVAELGDILAGLSGEGPVLVTLLRAPGRPDRAPAGVPGGRARDGALPSPAGAHRDGSGGVVPPRAGG